LRAAKLKSGGLTACEREVATLVARGQSNHEIAQTLIISENTDATHIGKILSKLEFESRTQIMSWAIEKGLVAPGSGSRE
jgi:DNA-binding NarL/FixJ family response regulator